jgi:oligoendopeptidase F
LAQLRAARQEADYYSFMAASADSDDADVQDLAAWLDERLTALGNSIRAFELEWMALPEQRAEELASAAEVAGDAHALRRLRLYVPYTLSAPEERVLAEREATALRAWQSLHGRHLSTLETEFDAGEGLEPHSVSRLETYFDNPDRQLRHRAYRSLRELVEPERAVLAQCYDSIVADRLLTDRLRGYPDPMLPAHLANELEPEVVESMLAAVEASYPVAQRWLRAKARLLGLPKLDYGDVRAPVGDAETFPWPDAERLAVGAFARVSGELADVAAGCFREGGIDAEPRRGKHSGAYYARASTRSAGFLFANHGDQLGDVVTLAHELGHATHYEFAARRQSEHSWEPGLGLAEVPSTFAQFLLSDHLEAAGISEATRRTLRASDLDMLLRSVYVQTVYVRYEQHAYGLRAQGVALTPERLAEAMRAEFGRLLGDAVEVTDDQPGWMWARIPHFIDTRFYTYAYVFACLIAFAAHARLRELPDFAARYAEFLSYGGSLPPAEQLAILEIDLNDPGVWAVGLAEIERRVAAIEASA